MNMTDEQMLDAIEARGTPLIFSNALKQWGWPQLVGHGWMGTRAKIEVELAGENAAELRSVLRVALEESYLYTHKAVYFWNTTDQDLMASVIRSMQGWVVTQGNPYGSFPAPVSELALRGITDLGVPTWVGEGEGLHSLVLCGKRRVAVEEHFDVDRIPEEFLRQGYEELIVRKMQVFQTFDCFAVYPALGLFELRIDHGHKLAEKDVLSLREGLRNKINSHAVTSVGKEILVGDPINIYQCMDELYHGKGWTVNKIGHANEDGFVNANKGRHRSSDVRESLYHNSGEKGVEQLQLWSIATSFEGFSKAGRPRLLLEGHSAMLSSLHPVLHLARILDCASTEDYHMVRDALLDCWGKAQKKAESSA